MKMKHQKNDNNIRKKKNFYKLSHTEFQEHHLSPKVRFSSDPVFFFFMFGCSFIKFYITTLW